MILFFAIAAVSNKIVIIADTTNTFQQSPPLTKPHFLEINEAYQSWYKKRFNTNIDWHYMLFPLGMHYKDIQKLVHSGNR